MKIAIHMNSKTETYRHSWPRRSRLEFSSKTLPSPESLNFPRGTAPIACHHGLCFWSGLSPGCKGIDGRVDGFVDSWGDCLLRLLFGGHYCCSLANPFAAAVKRLGMREGSELLDVLRRAISSFQYGCCGDGSMVSWTVEELLQKLWVITAAIA